MNNLNKLLNKRIHEYYWDHDLNCAETSLKTLSEIFQVQLEPQLLESASLMNGAGQYQAQCGLVNGPLMFLGVMLKTRGWKADDINKAGYLFAQEFSSEFGSLMCKDLRPGGFKEDDPPHLCEDLSNKTIIFTINFIKNLNDQ